MVLFQPKHTPPLKHEVNEYIIKAIKEWKDCEDWGEDDTYWFFWQDFDVFTEDIFKLADRTALRDLWEYLISHKIWVNKPTSGAPYATVLQEALQRYPKGDETKWIPYKWTEKEEQERQKVLAIQQARAIKAASFKVQDLPEEPTPTSNPSKPPTTEPAFPISPAVAIPTSAPTFIPTSAPTSLPTSTPTLTTPTASAPAPAELTPPPTPEMAALSPATCIPAEPQVQPRTLLTSCRNCQATFTSRNRLHKHLRFDCSSTTTRNVKSTITSSSPSLRSFEYVQQQITRHLNDLRLRSQPVYLLNQQPRNTSLSSTSLLSSRATATPFYAPATILLRVGEPSLNYTSYQVEPRPFQLDTHVLYKHCFSSNDKTLSSLPRLITASTNHCLD
jgi:hypothetical protein